MADVDFSRVRAMIGEANPLVRQGLRGVFTRAGFGEVLDTSSYVKVHHALNDGQIDLLVTASELEGSFTGYLINEMRHQRLKINPFVVVIMLLPTSDQDYIKKVVASGPDDLLLVPVAPDQLMARVEALSRVRKQFAVTHDYTGPDRRPPNRKTGDTIPVLDVPNPLKSKVDRQNTESLHRDMAVASQRLNAFKVERYGYHIEWLIGAVLVACRGGNDNFTAVASYMFQLNELAEDLGRRTEGWSNDVLARLSKELSVAAKDVSSAGAGASAKKLELLATTGRRTVLEIQRVFPRDHTAAHRGTA